MEILTKFGSVSDRRSDSDSKKKKKSSPKRRRGGEIEAEMSEVRPEMRMELRSSRMNAE